MTTSTHLKALYVADESCRGELDRYTTSAAAISFVDSCS